MELREPVLAAQKARLAEVLETPSLTGATRQNLGWVNLNEENADWSLCARVGVDLIQCRNHSPATSLVFQLGREIIYAHAWHDREPPQRIPPELTRYPSAGNWHMGIDKRPKRYHEQCIGQYVMAQMIRLGYCTIDWSSDDDCYVMLHPGKTAHQKGLTTYTQFHPFMLWRSYIDPQTRHQLVDTSIGTTWNPADWHFNWTPPELDEERLWHPHVAESYEANAWDKPTSSFFGNPTFPPEYSLHGLPQVWVRAVNKFEGNEYRISRDMLNLLVTLHDRNQLIPKQTKKQKKQTETLLSEAERLTEECFFQRVHCDYRGRMYTSRSSINYQGDDEVRCLFEFAKGVELTKQGYEYLLLHAGNLYEVSGNEHEKIAYVRNHLQRFISYAENPLDTQDEWRTDDDGEPLDDPYLFIRACMELRNATTGKRLIPKKGFISHLPVEVDQTNSVIQHLALFYGDRTIAEMCSLLVDSDFYGAIARDWEFGNLTPSQRRKVVKKFIVPRCYGAGAENIAEENLTGLAFLRRWSDERKLQLVENGIQQIENRVPALRNFRREVQRLIRETNIPNDGELAWPMPCGFEVHFRPVYVEKVRFKLPKDQTFKTANLSARYPTDRLNRERIRNGLQAHLVHSTDACVAHFVVAMTSYPVIALHDAFAAHANNVHDLREQFVKWMIRVHHFYKPYQYFRSLYLDDAYYPFGLMGYDDTVQAIDRLTEEIRESGYLGMIT